MAERAAWLMNNYSNRPVPVINGGSGSDQHPTQAILDIYTLQGPLKTTAGWMGRPSSCAGTSEREDSPVPDYLMKNFQDVKIIYAAPKPFQMEQICSLFSGEHDSVSY